MSSLAKIFSPRRAVTACWSRCSGLIDSPLCPCAHNQLFPSHKEPRCCPVHCAIDRKSNSKNDIASANNFHFLFFIFFALALNCQAVCVSTLCIYNSAHWVLSKSRFRQWLTSVGSGHATLNNNLLLFPYISCVSLWVLALPLYCSGLPRRKL